MSKANYVTNSSEPIFRAIATAARFCSVGGLMADDRVAPRTIRVEAGREIRFPAFVKTDEDKRRFLAALSKVPAREELDKFAIVPSAEWLEQRSHK